MTDLTTGERLALAFQFSSMTWKDTEHLQDCESCQELAQEMIRTHTEHTTAEEPKYRPTHTQRPNGTTAANTACIGITPTAYAPVTQHRAATSQT